MQLTGLDLATTITKEEVIKRKGKEARGETQRA